jgi:hypothetical protein
MSPQIMLVKWSKDILMWEKIKDFFTVIFKENLKLQMFLDSFLEVINSWSRIFYPLLCQQWKTGIKNIFRINLTTLSVAENVM